jgi:hypothetical protein
MSFSILTIPSRTIVTSRPPPPFYNLPLEIRLKILHWAIIAHALVHQEWMGGLPYNSSCNSFQAFRPFPKGKIDLQPAYPPWLPDTRLMCAEHWGTKRMHMIFPVCRQWYDEIQVAFYSMFRFHLCYTEVIETWKPHAFAFLPRQALPLIRDLNLEIWEDWTRLVIENRQADLIRSCENIAASLLGLAKMKLTFCYWSRCRGPYTLEDVTPEIEAKVSDTIVAMCRPFKRIPGFRMEERYLRGREGPTAYLLYHRLILETIEVVEEQMKLEKEEKSDGYLPQPRHEITGTST